MYVISVVAYSRAHMYICVYVLSQIKKKKKKKKNRRAVSWYTCILTTCMRVRDFAICACVCKLGFVSVCECV